MSSHRILLLKSVGVVIACGMIAGIAAYIGFAEGLRIGLSHPDTIVVREFSHIDVPQDIAIDFTPFWDAWRTVRYTYLNADKVDNQELLYGAIRGMVDAYKDPYTVFLDPQDARKFNEDIQGSFGGIGAEIGIRNNQLMIIAPLKNSPAERAGLLPRDKIIMINETSTLDMSVDEAIKLIRGTPGTIVTLSILRDDWTSPKNMKIARAVINIPVLDAHVEHNALIIELYSFNNQAPALFYDALRYGSQFPDIEGLIIDLRNNPGGYLDVAVDLASWFIDRGDVIVSERFGNGNEHIFRSTRDAILKHIPTVILMNQGSASAAEIFAGALRDQLGIPIVGEKSFGKGSVQELRTLRDGSVVKITVAEWVLPKGMVIEGVGIIPDVTVLMQEADVLAGRDPQFEKAFEVLQSLIEKK